MITFSCSVLLSWPCKMVHKIKQPILEIELLSICLSVAYLGHTKNNDL